MSSTTNTIIPDNTEILIIGGGIMGLSIAYQLCLRGLTDIVILERSYLTSGASGRNGGGVRQQWSTENNIRLMQESVELFRNFATEFKLNTWFRQDGYLFLARDKKTIGQLEKNIRTQNQFGVPTTMLSPEQVCEMIPELDGTDVIAAAYNPTDGVLFPWPFIWGYKEQILNMGGKIYTFNEVVDIDVVPNGFVTHTPKGSIKSKRIINAAGAWSPNIASMIDIDLPTTFVRHEICSSEPLKHFLTPMVSDLSTGLYFSQSMRGEIVGGVSVKGQPSSDSMQSTFAFLTTYAFHLSKIIPLLNSVKILRQWAGPYDISPDGNPILGAPKHIPEFYFCSGFVGHGFMMAPIIGVYYADWLANGMMHPIFEQYALDRFNKKNIPLEKETLIIG